MTTQPIRNKKHIHQLSVYFLSRGEFRNHLLFIMGIHTALRVSDMLRLTWADVYDFANQRPRREFSVTEHKTRKSKTIAINAALADSLQRLFSHLHPRAGAVLFENSHTHKAICRIQAYRILRKAAEEACVDVPVSCHSLRKTFGYHLLKKGISIAIIMDIYNHSSYAVTRRYLGITQDDKNSAYLRLQYGT